MTLLPSSAPTNRRNFGAFAGWLARGLALVTSLAVCLVLVRTTGFEARSAELVLAALGLPLAVVFLVQGSRVAVHAFAWRGLLGTLGASVSRTTSFAITLSSEAIQSCLPGGGAVADATGIWLWSRRGGVRESTGLASTAIKKALWLLSNSVFLSLAVAFGPSWLAKPAFAGAPSLESILLGFALVLLLGGAALLFGLSYASPGRKLLALSSRLPFPRISAWFAKRRGDSARLDAQLSRVSGLRGAAQLAVPGFLLLLTWLSEAVETFLLLRLLGMPLGFTDALALEAGATSVRSLSFFVPAGLGTQDAAYLGLFASLGALDHAAPFLALKRAKELFWAVAGLCVWLLLRREPLLSPEPALSLTRST